MEYGRIFGKQDLYIFVRGLRARAFIPHWMGAMIGIYYTLLSQSSQPTLNYVSWSIAQSPERHYSI